MDAVTAAAEEPRTLEEARAAWRGAVEALAARELQLERKGAEVSDVQALCRQLQASALHLLTSPGVAAAFSTCCQDEGW